MNQQKNTAMVIISYPTVSVLDRQTRDVLEVLQAVLTGGGASGGRLFHELRGQRLVYYVFGFHLTGLAPGYVVFMAQTRAETTGEVIRRIEENVARIAAEGIPAEEFAKAKQKLIAGHALGNTTPSSQAFSAALDELYGLGYDYDASYDERIRKVTVQHVQNAVKRYFQKPTIVTSSATGPPNRAAPKR